VEIPLLSADLIKELRLLYPLRHPSLALTDREVWFKAGQSSVIDGLETSLLLQEENLIDKKIISRS
jgi:hypothetical protein